MRSKLGLFTEEADDTALVDELLAWMQRAGRLHQHVSGTDTGSALEQRV